jgi:hypothetical protein
MGALPDANRYRYLETSMLAPLAVARGRCDWPALLADGSVTA